MGWNHQDIRIENVPYAVLILTYQVKPEVMGVSIGPLRHKIDVRVYHNVHVYTGCRKYNAILLNLY